MNQQPSVWELAADDVIAVVMNDRSAYDLARYEMGLTPGHMPEGAHKEAYRAICYLYDTNQPIHDTAILDRCNGNTNLSWIAQRVALYDTTRTGEVFKVNVSIVKREGLAVGTRQLLGIAGEQIAQGKDRELVVNRLVDMLTTISADKQIKMVRASEHGPLNRQRRLETVKPGMPTGLDWLNTITAGWEEKHIWWLAGAYKSRKTTVALNLALSAAMRGMHVAFLSKEMPQERVQLQLTAMLAVAYLEKCGLYDKTYETTKGEKAAYNWISAQWLKQIGPNYLKTHPQKVAAIEWADNTYANLPLRIYDPDEEHGGLSDLASLQRVINRDMIADGGKLFFIDYLQLFDAPGGSYFDKVSTLARSLQDMARSKGITLCVLAQKNEESIRDGGESYSPGIKGGGDPAQTADYLLTTKYKADEDSADDGKLTVQMKLSRHGPAGNSMKEVFDIHPGSGLILKQSWVKEL